MKKILGDTYSDEEYNELNNQAQNIIDIANNFQTDLEKLLTIYYILGKNIYYDYYWDEYGKLVPSNWDGNQSLVRWTT